MASITINGKTVEIKGVTTDKLVSERPAGSGGKGISGAIKAMIEAAADEKIAPTISELSKKIVELFPDLPKGQQRQRVENTIRNSNGRYVKKWNADGMAVVVRVKK
jgi:hypothetical protein